MATICDLFPEYRSTTLLDDLRRSEYDYLDANHQVYLDYTGSGLAARSQRQHHEQRLSQFPYGNPHSINPSSAAATEAIERTRARILAHVNASPADYAVVFTPNATGAARLVGEAYPFRKGTRYVLTADNHNSVNGIREFARAKKATTVYVPLAQGTDLRVGEKDVLAALAPKMKRGKTRQLVKSALNCRGGMLGRLASSLPCHHDSNRDRQVKKKGLFAYPAQSNFSGVQHPLSWVSLAQQAGYHVLLDAAAFLPTSPLDLSGPEGVKPDFVLISWYKVFGYPTGVGCLIARRDALAVLRRPWFSGGTVQAVAVSTTGSPRPTVTGDNAGAAGQHFMAEGEQALEDGTANFLSIPDVHFGLDWLAGVVGMRTVQTRVRCLTAWFLARLQSDEMRHADGRPMARIYGPRSMRARGATVAFNFLDAKGRVVDDGLVALESAAAGISLRTGCFCNPGASERALRLDINAILERLAAASAGKEGKYDGLGETESIRVAGRLAPGAVRVSFGLASTSADVDEFFAFACETYKDRVIAPIGSNFSDGSFEKKRG
ncbi:PLP-dependent transferase [Canariomyces notabilis]|uniref:PLP-dependent transferase n=1 Tax=Canariomyces notabilis TaxID=2074819 RepID=A0AAN6TFU3_9PEZI|nr:PLP-dependent transferase [Canariomyces arenarius]